MKKRTLPEEPDQGLLEHLEQRRITEEHCFLCGCDLSEENSSREHVIPKWTQRRFELWDEKLTLQNGSLIPYRLLMIPCCRVCNSEHLGQVENVIKQAVIEGPEATRELEKATLFFWLSKILYGLLYREVLLLTDRSDPSKGPIVPPDFVRSLTTFHYLMQGFRVPFQFPTGVPASIFVFDVLNADDYPVGEWDIRTSVHTLSLSIKMGNTGILALLQDGRVNKEIYSDYMADFQQFPLHPLQFRELSVKAFYKTSLIKQVPKFMMFERDNGNEVTVVQAPVGGMTGTVEFEPWDQKVYADILEEVLHVPIQFVPPNLVSTYLKNEDGLVHQYVDGEFLLVD